jgi:hypothetical protein
MTSQIESHKYVAHIAVSKVILPKVRNNAFLGKMLHSNQEQTQVLRGLILKQFLGPSLRKRIQNYGIQSWILNEYLLRAPLRTVEGSRAS